MPFRTYVFDFCLVDFRHQLDMADITELRLARQGLCLNGVQLGLGDDLDHQCDVRRRIIESVNTDDVTG